MARRHIQPYRGLTISVLLTRTSSLLRTFGQQDIAFSTPDHQLRNTYYKAFYQELKTRLQRSLEKESVDLLIAAFIQSPRYGIRFSKQGDPWITQPHCYGVLTPLPHYLFQILTTSFATELFFGSKLDLGLVLLVLERQREVDWTYVASIMEDNFPLYNCHVGKVVTLPIRNCQ